MPTATPNPAEDRHWMSLAIELSRQCPPAEGAYSVGAVIVDTQGREVSRGYSRDTDPKVHAEESALATLAADDPRLAGATLYSTLEPCSQRASRPRSCAHLILATGIRRVVIAWREPSLFVANCQGVEMLTDTGITVDQLPDLAETALRRRRSGARGVRAVAGRRGVGGRRPDRANLRPARRWRGYGRRAATVAG